MTLDLGLETPCRTGDPDEWFPDDNRPDRWAQKLCQGCPLLHPCGEWALGEDEHGVWGGMTRRRRRYLQKLRGFVPAQRPSPSPPSTSIPEKALHLWAESERLRGEGLTLPVIAEQFGISAAYLVDARARARKHLGVAS